MIEFREVDNDIRIYHEGNPVLNIIFDGEKYRMAFGATDDDDDLCLSRMSRLTPDDLEQIADKMRELNAQL